ncbi:hypothetical protein Lal_00043681, partial [Lupinus albus]
AISKPELDKTIPVKPPIVNNIIKPNTKYIGVLISITPPHIVANQLKILIPVGSPPPVGSKKVVLKLRSVNNIVIAPANTGNDISNKKAVIKTDHTNKGNLDQNILVQPVPAPFSIKDDDNNKKKDGGNNQKLILFKRGNAISGAPIIKGTNQLPKPPIKAGITIKKIIIKAC